MVLFLIPSLLVFVIAIVFIRHGLSSKGKTRPLSYSAGFPGTQKVLVPPFRVKMAACALAVLGLIFLSLAVPSLALVDNWREAFSYFSIAMLLAGVYFVYTGIKLYQRKDNIVQLELYNDHIGHKPEKWYSISRAPGGVNALSVFLYPGMITTPLKDIGEVVLISSSWQGSYIRLLMKNGKQLPLIVITENNVQIEELYYKVKDYVERNR